MAKSKGNLTSVSIVYKNAGILVTYNDTNESSHIYKLLIVIDFFRPLTIL